VHLLVSELYTKVQVLCLCGPDC